jgi:hypothetical protein
MEGYLTTRQLARIISEDARFVRSIEEWQVRRLYEDGDVPEPTKFGGKRCIHRDELPRMLSALLRRGWLSLGEGARHV